MAKSNKKTLTVKQQQDLLITLQTRFEKNKHRHKGIVWAKVAARLKTNTNMLWTLNEMEISGGEPDIIEFDSLLTGKGKDTGEFVFCDCSPESPKGRRSICYDHKALDARKENKPKNTAMDMAAEMGIEILSEQQYRELQLVGNFDTKTSSWIQTPDTIRKLGGALFCDRRYNTVFVYHNGAESYYAARGFRGFLKI